MAEAIVLMVVGRLNDLLIDEPQLLHEVRDEIQQMVEELTQMNTLLPDADSRINQEHVRILLAEWMNTRKFSRKINDIKRKMSLLCKRFHECNIRPTLKSPDSSGSTHGTPGKLKRFHTFTTVEPEIFVGFQGDVDCLVGHLVDECDNSYPLISICGMGGLGKTTLAQKIYNHATIKTYFSGLAWVSISQKWQTKQVLQRLLICLVHDKKEEIFTWGEDKLVKNLLQIQQQKKCLIVLDDIWSKDAWDSIKLAFTAKKSISKLLLTSRNLHVAKHVNPKGLIHQPGFLNPNQSWELLRLKALLTRGDILDIARDYDRMEQWGRKMVKHCAGLPLAIVILGGVLVTKPSLDEWERVYNDSLSSLKKGKGLGEKQQEQLLNFLVQSYNVLPPQLKPCFLYLSKFMEDEWIDAESLYQIWIAEGMVLSSDKNEGETMMQVAETYMGELFHRSMVQVKFNDSESSLTKFESCCLHDVMRDLSLYQAKAEDFFQTIDLRERNDYHLNSPVVSPISDARQLVVYHSRYRNARGMESDYSYFTKKPSHQQYRSILLLMVDGSLSQPLQLRSYFANFELLRVLSLDNIWHSTQSGLGTLLGTKIERVLSRLVYLRYLSLSDSELMIFPGIQNLVLLQTLKLDVREFTYMAPVSSNILGKLSHLRHLCLPDQPYPITRKNFKLRFNGLSKLETLENFNTSWCEVKDLPKLLSLRRLKLLAVGDVEVKEVLRNLSDLASSPNSCLQYLALYIYISDQGFKDEPDMIRQLFWNDKFMLQELGIFGQLPELAELFKQQLNHTHIDVSFIRITALELRNSDLEEDPMPVLEKIPTLRELELDDAYNGKEMVCSAMGFPKLTLLHLWSLTNLEKWRVEDGSMPFLQDLQIQDCPKLQELSDALRAMGSNLFWIR